MKTTKRKINLACTAVLALALALAAVAVSSTGSQPTIIFPHDMHVEGMELECETCHAGAAESISGTDNLIPGMDVCEACHDIEDTDNCSLCHPDMDNLDVYYRVEDYSPLFNHQVHIEQEFACDLCHKGVSSSASAADLHLPGMGTYPVMDLCIDCHNGMRAPNACTTCHLEGRGKIQEKRGKIPADHNFSQWIRHRQHGDDAKIDNAESCMACHQRSWCMECHQGDNLFFGNRPHPPGYEFKHPLDVRSGRIECAACHESRDFCAECHFEENVYPRSHQRGLWASRTSGGRHAIEARINLEQCTSCHGEETGADPVCAVCHGE
ncbi:MAG: hypothetical protein FVQ81_04600 [Candidatus Glassbacteria bacterium]|nr:hypothetical protein [Candidatus Glassbacteria bacterium]